MVTDSKYFLLQPLKVGRGPRYWYQRGNRPMQPGVAHSKGVHVYLGVTAYGVTRPIFVAGGGTPSTYFDAKGKRFVGCCSQEYIERVLPVFIEDGNALFKGSECWRSRWVFQQDGASIHKSKDTLEFLDSQLPGRVMSDWPACSPDLSWIENMWSYSERRLRATSPTFSSIEELQSELTKVFSSIPKHILKNHVEGMKGRLQKCIALKGYNIGK